MRTAFGVQLTNKKPKTEDVTDRLNYGLFIHENRFYRGRNSENQLLTAQVQRLARPMTNELALQVAEKLRGEADEVSVIEIITDEETEIASSLVQLGRKNRSLSSSVQMAGGFTSRR